MDTVTSHRSVPDERVQFIEGVRRDTEAGPRLAAGIAELNAMSAAAPADLTDGMTLTESFRIRDSAGWSRRISALLDEFEFYRRTTRASAVLCWSTRAAPSWTSVGPSACPTSWRAGSPRVGRRTSPGPDPRPVVIGATMTVVPRSDRVIRHSRLIRRCPVIVLLLVASCGGAPTEGSGTSTTSTTAAGAPGTTTGSGNGAGDAPLVLTGADNGRSVTVAVGARVTLVLASTYWTVDPTSGDTVLRSDGQPVTSPRPAHCVPGQGCGTVTARYTAVAPGTEVVAAGRTVCGEALACTPAAGSFHVDVTVR